MQRILILLLLAIFSILLNAQENTTQPISVSVLSRLQKLEDNLELKKQILQLQEQNETLIQWIQRVEKELENTKKELKKEIETSKLSVKGNDSDILLESYDSNLSSELKLYNKLKNNEKIGYYFMVGDHSGSGDGGQNFQIFNFRHGENFKYTHIMSFDHTGKTIVKDIEVNDKIDFKNGSNLWRMEVSNEGLILKKIVNNQTTETYLLKMEKK